MSQKSQITPPQDEGRAQHLFRRLEDGGVAAIQELIVERASEELFLDFKRSSDDGSGARLSDKDRNNLRKAIGGFANSEGGIIVWGVDCSRDVQLGDVANALRPITNPKRFVSWLEGAVSGCTIPPVIGVRSIAVLHDEGTGFVVTFVPQSFHAPHQLAGEGKYVIRAGSDFVPAPHGVVAGLFGKPPHPVVFPMFIASRLEYHKQGNTEIARTSITVVLVNDGQVVAEDLFVSLVVHQAPGGPRDLEFEPKVKWESSSGVGRDISWMCPRDFRLAPGGQVQVVKLILNCAQSVAGFRWLLTVGCKGAIPCASERAVSKVRMGQILNSYFFAEQQGDRDFDVDKASTELFGL